MIFSRNGFFLRDGKNIITATIFMTGSIYALAQDTPIDQYKQMGSLAGIAESCYGSKAIPERLNVVVKQSVSKNPSISDVMKTLVTEYNTAYKKAILDRKIWIGTESAYSKKPFDCSSKSDMELIKKFELTILSNFK